MWRRSRISTYLSLGIVAGLLAILAVATYRNSGSRADKSDRDAPMGAATTGLAKVARDNLRIGMDEAEAIQALHAQNLSRIHGSTRRRSFSMHLESFSQLMVNCNFAHDESGTPRLKEWRIESCPIDDEGDVPVEEYLEEVRTRRQEDASAQDDATAEGDA